MQTLSAPTREIRSQLAGREVFELIKDEMALVEAEFERLASSNIQVINYLGDYLRSSGGKRVRPALLVLSTFSAGGDGRAESVIRLATVMEVLHTATLVHDDIIDNADLRRNRVSVNARFGNQTAVLMGDWLYMSAFEASLKERSLRILDILTTLTRKMTEGELIQLTLTGKLDITEEQYFDILRRKTAYLFSACCQIGAILAGAEETTQLALGQYGLDLGTAFQLTDDLLDVIGEENALGKPAGADILEGKVTLPLILFQRHYPAIRPRLTEIMYNGAYPSDTRSEILSRMSESGIAEAIRERALTYASSARKNLEVLRESEYSLALDALPGYIIERIN